MYYYSFFRAFVASAILSCLFFIQSAHAVDVTYYHTDLLGSPVATSDELGNLKWAEHYKPYGERIVKDPESASNEMWYTGKQHDADTGLTYFNARYYDPVVGRFMATDPAPFNEVVLGSFNRYSYANNNPYLYNDPNGEVISNVVGGLWAGFQNIAMQSLERSLGLRDSFSFSELAAEASIGAVTSGLSTIKNAGKLGSLAAKAKISNTRKEGGVQANRAQGKAGEAITESKLKQDGSFAGRQVTFETSTGKRSVIDFVINSKGGKGIVETKTGKAKLSAGQGQLFDDIENGRPVIPRGQNAVAAGLTPGRPTILNGARIDRP